MKIVIEVKANSESKVSACVLSSYILRAIAGVVGANKGMILSYRCDHETKKDD